jgi:hypothetical protein
VKKASKNGGRSTGGKKVKPEPVDSDGLSPKEAMFVNAYLGEAKFNAAQAMRMIGHEGSDPVLYVSGHRLLRNVKVAAVVRARIDEAAMSSNEVLSRLSDIASGNISDLIDEDGKFDLKQAKQRGKDRLLKKLKIKRTSKQVDSITSDSEERETLETALVYEEVEFEMYSAHEALRDLGKYHKLFTEKMEHSNPDGSPLLAPIADAVMKVYGPPISRP